MFRKLTIKALAAIAVFAVVFGAAASLGGVNSGKLGADDAAVASCDTDGVSTSYASAWDATDKRYEVSSVSVSAVADTCDGQTVRVSLTDSTGASIGSGSAAIPASTATSVDVSLSSQPASKSVTNVHVTIS